MTEKEKKERIGNGFWVDENGNYKGDTYKGGTYSEPTTGIVADAKNALTNHLNSRPTYTNSWQGQISEVLKQIEGRDKFNYDINGDAFYQQYKDKYTKLGKLASADVMGQAAAMTGGYGNSYAATVGNQAYQAQLGKLNDIVPELYQMAYDRYNQDTQDLYNLYSLYADRENADYNKYKASLDAWQADRSHLQNLYDSERDLDYAIWSDAEAANREQWYSDYENAYKASQDYIANLVAQGYVVDENGNVVSAPEDVGLEKDVAPVLDPDVDDKYGYQLDNLDTAEEQAEFVQSLVDNGLPQEQGDALLDKHIIADLTKADWVAVDNGGGNMGIDRNAVVKTGEVEYTLGELFRQLKKTMNPSEARAYVMNLQKRLGIG